MSNKFRKQAIKKLVNYTASFSLDENGKIVMWGSDTPQPSEEVISEKTAQLKSLEPMRLLREERDRKLTETDWWCASDQTPTKGQLDYRKSLRDLPSTAKPELDENGNLTGVEWPTKPE